MSKFRLVAVMALLMTPAFAFASQGSGTGTDSAGGRSYLTSQGSGTGADSVSGGNHLRSQGSGTGSNSHGSDAIAGGTRGNFYANGVYTRQAFQQHSDILSCLANLRCMFNIKK